MQTEAHREANAGTQDVNVCPNCHTLMPSELRFCRACGCRLGEGVEEYTETVRFDGAQATGRAARAKTASAAPPLTSPAGVREWGAAARSVREQALRSAATNMGRWKMARTCSRVPKWMVWVFLPIIAVSIMGGMSSHRNNGSGGGRSAVSAGGVSSYMGAEYKTAPGGVFVRDVKPQG